MAKYLGITLALVSFVGTLESVSGQELTYEDAISSDKYETVVDSKRFHLQNNNWGLIRLYRLNTDPSYMLRIQYLETNSEGEFKVKQEIDKHKEVAHRKGLLELNDFNSDGALDVYVLLHPMNGDPQKGIYYWGSNKGDFSTEPPTSSKK